MHEFYKKKTEYLNKHKQCLTIHLKTSQQNPCWVSSN